MRAYSRIDEVTVSTHSNTGQGGWGFKMWSDLLDDEAPHRSLIERFATAYPEAGISLPAYWRWEDYVECCGTWDGAGVWVYYETILSYLYFWSENREAAKGIRAAVLPLVD